MSNNNVISNQSHSGLKQCLRCGYECDSAYCPHCGCQMDVPRLSFKRFFTDMAAEIYLINGVFFHTVANLLIRPWKVIREYIHGRRDDYTSPVGVLVILLFIGSFVTSLLDLSSAEILSVSPNSGNVFQRCWNAIVTYLNKDQIWIELIVPIPALLIMVAVYWKQGARKYNIAEYFTATLYLEASADVVGLLLSPLDSEKYGDGTYVFVTIYAIIICAISSYKAFPCKSHTQRILKYILFLSLTSIAYIIICTMIYLIGLD